MSKTKYYYYVLVMTNYGAVFVTSINNAERTAKWDKLETPLDMSKKDAEFMAKALTWNGNLAYAVTTEYELSYQPYLYQKGEFKWVEKEKDNENNKKTDKD